MYAGLIVRDHWVGSGGIGGSKLKAAGEQQESDKTDVKDQKMGKTAKMCKITQQFYWVTN